MSKQRTTVTVDFGSHKRVSIAARLIGEEVGEFFSKAADKRSSQVLKKHNVKLPADAEPSPEPVLQAA